MPLSQKIQVDLPLTFYVGLSICLPVSLYDFLCMSVYLSVFLSMCVFIYLCQSIYLCVWVYLSLCVRLCLLHQCPFPSQNLLQQYKSTTGKILDLIIRTGYEVSAVSTVTFDRTQAEEFLEVYKGVVPDFHDQVPYARNRYFAFFCVFYFEMGIYWWILSTRGIGKYVLGRAELISVEHGKGIEK